MPDEKPVRSCSGTANPGRHWRKRFLETLAATSDIERAASAARVTVARAQQVRRTDTGFARDWQAAIADGYLNLEIEVIRRLREGDLMTANGDKFDFANAIRLLAARRDRAASAQHSQIRDVSAAEVRASIDRKIEDIRRRVARQKAARGEET
ncbi:hypothetical protein [Erythrobacter dokdonensis]|jgi:hypothetical protein|uniref:Terminase small subunit n=1 Tax=Erythrobacter dokdonensis DSW-74 TaxID=1300349 RepID=A0A1A7BFE1_9SPHN|nr:hypothetical protein [Erythrobacter dokdonensis]MEE4316717.1 hypothetical protein [Erythrobacter sp.]OBV09940.1 hypothetical protein I603_2836 [Erythrobacter dokdonensis DSW-74]